MNKIVVIIIIILFPFLVVCGYSQCPCSGATAVGVMAPVGGGGSVGFLRQGNLRAIAFYSSSYGNENYTNDSKTEPGLIKEFKSSLFALNIGYGINEDFTAEAEFYAYPEKKLDYFSYIKDGSGLSHIALNLKYNIVNLRSKELEWTVGIGGKIPLQTGEETEALRIQASTGASGLIFQSLISKGFKKYGLHLIFANRIENNFENKNLYQYGYSIINSIFLAKSFGPMVILELRSDTRTRDKRYGEYITDSGSNCLILSPQLALNIGEFNASFLFEIPVYKYYFGSQLSRGLSLGLTLSWQKDLLGR